jgi:hypothetical protein
LKGLKAMAHAPGDGRNSSPDFSQSPSYIAKSGVSGADCRHSADGVFFIGGASVKLFLPIFKMNFPEIADIAPLAEGVFQNLVFAESRRPVRID